MPKYKSYWEGREAVIKWMRKTSTHIEKIALKVRTSRGHERSFYEELWEEMVTQYMEMEWYVHPRNPENIYQDWGVPPKFD